MYWFVISSIFCNQANQMVKYLFYIILYIMILDKYLKYKEKIIISIIIGVLWIYTRSFDCYNLLPRRNILVCLIVSIWIYLNYKEPLFLGIGLVILYVVCEMNK